MGSKRKIPHKQVQAIKARNYHKKYPLSIRTSNRGNIIERGITLKKLEQINQRRQQMMFSNDLIHKNQRDDGIISKLIPNKVEAKISPVPGIIDLKATWDLKS